MFGLRPRLVRLDEPKSTSALSMPSTHRRKTVELSSSCRRSVSAGLHACSQRSRLVTGVLRPASRTPSPRDEDFGEMAFEERLGMPGSFTQFMAAGQEASVFNQPMGLGSFGHLSTAYTHTHIITYSIFRFSETRIGQITACAAGVAVGRFPWVKSSTASRVS